MLSFLNTWSLKYNNKLYFISLCLLIISFPLSIAINSIVVGLILLCFILDFKKLKEHSKLYITNKRNLLLLALFISLLISLIHTEHIDKGTAKVLGYLPMISLPLALTKLKTLSGRQIRYLKLLHIIVCLLAALFCLIMATLDSGLIDGTYRDQVAPELYVAYFIHRFSYHQLSEKVHLHAIYFSLFIAVAMFLTIIELMNATKRRQLLLMLTLLFFSVFLFLLKSVVINFAFYSFLLLYLYFLFSFKKPAHHFLFYILSILSSAIVFYLYILKYIGNFSQNTYLLDDPSLNNQFLIVMIITLLAAMAAVAIKLFFPKKYLPVLLILFAISFSLFASIQYQKRVQPPHIHKEKEAGTNNVSARSATWLGAWHIIKEHPLTGVGAGDEIPALVEEYKKINFETGIRDQFNAHNQYLEFWVGGGIIAFICFVLLLLSETHKAYLQHNISLLSLLYFFSVFSLTESTMCGQFGRIFFLFFLCLLGSSNIKNTLSVANK